MANLPIILKIPILIADTNRYLTNITSKIYKTAGSIGFIKNALYHEVTQKFEQVHGNFINKSDKTKSERGILLSYHSNDHVCRSKDLLEHSHKNRTFGHSFPFLMTMIKPTLNDQTESD